MDLKGQKMLKVCSILMIIFGALGLLFSILGFVGVAVLEAIIQDSVEADYASQIIGLVASAVQLVAGIVGFQAAKMPSVNKIKLSLLSGLLVVVLAVVAAVLSIVASGFVASGIIGLLFRLVIPVLFLIGLIQYKNALVALLSGD